MYSAFARIICRYVSAPPPSSVSDSVDNGTTDTCTPAYSARTWASRSGCVESAKSVRTPASRMAVASSSRSRALGEASVEPLGTTARPR